jgi:hypothetical protein
VFVILETFCGLLSDGSRDSLVGIVTDCGQGSIPVRGKNIFFTASRLTWEGVPASYSMGTGVISVGVKRLGGQAAHLPPFNAEMKNAGAIPSLPHTSSGQGA